MKPSSLPLRSFLFAPGNHARRVVNALSLNADAVILDLEDAVATAEKLAARGDVAAALTRPRQSLLYVRVNAIDTDFCYGDLVAVVRRGLAGCGKSRDFGKRVMKRARNGDPDLIKSTGYEGAKGDELGWKHHRPTFSAAC
jgi:hypothetical protein